MSGHPLLVDFMCVKVAYFKSFQVKQNIERKTANNFLSIIVYT